MNRDRHRIRCASWFRNLLNDLDLLFIFLGHVSYCPTFNKRFLVLITLQGTPTSASRSIMPYHLDFRELPKIITLKFPAFHPAMPVIGFTVWLISAGNSLSPPDSAC